MNKSLKVCISTIPFSSKQSSLQGMLSNLFNDEGEFSKEYDLKERVVKNVCRLVVTFSLRQ